MDVSAPAPLSPVRSRSHHNHQHQQQYHDPNSAIISQKAVQLPSTVFRVELRPLLTLEPDQQPSSNEISSASNIDEYDNHTPPSSQSAGASSNGGIGTFSRSYPPPSRHHNHDRNHSHPHERKERFHYHHPHHGGNHHTHNASSTPPHQHYDLDHSQASTNSQAPSVRLIQQHEHWPPEPVPNPPIFPHTYTSPTSQHKPFSFPFDHHDHEDDENDHDHHHRRPVTSTTANSQNGTFHTAAEDNHDEPPDPFKDVPDGGFGWLVIFACVVLTFFCTGITYNWGIFQKRFVDDNLASTSTLSYVGSLAIGVVSPMALFSNRLASKIGTRNSALIGSTIFGSALLLSSFATNSVIGLFFTAGIMSGIGTGIIFMVTSILPSQYFRKRHGLAVGIVYAGSGAGGAAWSFVIDGLIDHVGIPWTFRLIGASALVFTIPASLFMRDREKVRVPSVFVEWHLFKDTRFCLLFSGGAMSTFALLSIPFLAPLYASYLGLSTRAGAGLVSAYNLASALGRIGFGLLCDRIGAINSLSLTTLITALSLLIIWPSARTLVPFAVFIAVNGASAGGFFSTMPSVVKQLRGPNVGTALGMLVTSWGPGYIMGAPIAGYMLDAQKGPRTIDSFHPVIWYTGAVALITATLILISSWLSAWKKPQHVYHVPVNNDSTVTAADSTTPLRGNTDNRIDSESPFRGTSSSVDATTKGDSLPPMTEKVSDQGTDEMLRNQHHEEHVITLPTTYPSMKPYKLDIDFESRYPKMKESRLYQSTGTATIGSDNEDDETETDDGADGYRRLDNSNRHYYNHDPHYHNNNNNHH